MLWNRHERPGALVGQPQGRVDESNWSEFAGHLTAAIGDAAGRRFIIDLGAVDYMSSRGLRALSTALAAAKKAGVDMALAAPGPAMREILAISRYDKLFVVHASLDAALG
jgi:anti-sigma B factor antagonist